MKRPGYYERPGLLLGRLAQSASWVIFEVTGLCTPLRCRWAHPHSGPSGNSFIRPSEWPHSSPSPPLVTLRLCRGPRTNFSLFLGPLIFHAATHLQSCLAFCSYVHVVVVVVEEVGSLGGLVHGAGNRLGPRPRC